MWLNAVGFIQIEQNWGLQESITFFALIKVECMCLWKNGPSTMLTLLTHLTGQEGIFCMLMSKILIIHYTYTSHPSHCLWFSEKVPEQSLRFNDILQVSSIFSIILESTLRFKNILSASRSFNKIISYLYIYRYAHTSWSSY